MEAKIKISPQDLKDLEGLFNARMKSQGLYHIARDEVLATAEAILRPHVEEEMHEALKKVGQHLYKAWFAKNPAARAIGGRSRTKTPRKSSRKKASAVAAPRSRTRSSSRTARSKSKRTGR